MKRMICGVLSLFLLFTGCQKSPASTTNPATAPPEVPTTSATTEISPPSVILDMDGRISAISCTDDFCVATIVSQDDYLKLVSIDLAAQKILGEYSPKDFSYDVFAFPDGIAVLNWLNMDLTVFSPAFEELWSRNGEDLPLGEIHADGCYYGIDENFDIVQLSLSTQEEKRQHLPNGLVPNAIVTTQDNHCLVEYSDEDGNSMRKWLDMKTGELVGEQPLADAYYPMRGNFYQTYYGPDATYLRNSEGEPVYTLPFNNLTNLTSTQTHALFYELDTGLLLWDLEDGAYWRQPTDYLWMSAISGQKVVYAEQDHPGKLYLWTPNPAHPDGDTAKVLTKAELEEANQALTTDIEGKTGIRIFYGEQGSQFNGNADTGYASENCDDALLLHMGLTHIKCLTEELPSGLFQEILPIGTDQLELYLTGTISQTYEEQPPVSAFTTTLGERQVLVADLNYADTSNEFRANIVHQFMHMMESRINECAAKDNMPYLPYWLSFAPAPDAYVYSYRGEDGMIFWDSTYTAASDIPLEEVSFLDAYSRTFPEEDRARILESLYLGANSPFPYKEVLQGGKLAEKAQYLCALIRHCFPSCQIEQQLPWETLVDVVPFSEYEEALKSYQSQTLRDE